MKRCYLKLKVVNITDSRRAGRKNNMFYRMHDD